MRGDVSVSPKPDDLLLLMRMLLADNPQQNAIIVMGTDTEAVVVHCDDMPPRPTLDMILEARKAGIIPPARWTAMVSDTYTLAVKPEELDARPGDLAAAFAAGDPRVKEAIMGMCVSPDGPSYCVQQSYVRDEDGEIEYDRIEDLPLHQVGGELLPRMRAVMDLA